MIIIIGGVEKSLHFLKPTGAILRLQPSTGRRGAGQQAPPQAPAVLLSAQHVLKLVVDRVRVPQGGSSVAQPCVLI